MQPPTKVDAIALARGRARTWLRVFLQLVRVLDRLEHRQESLLAASLVFLVRRAMGKLDAPEPAVAIAARGHEAAESEAGLCEAAVGGAELMRAVELARPRARRDARPLPGPGELRELRELRDAREPRELRDEPANEELEILLVLCGALTESADEGGFGDLARGADAIAEEFRSLQQFSAAEIGKTSLLPPAMRQRWIALLVEAAGHEDPLRRLARELSLSRVVQALYAMAIGYRRAAGYDRDASDHDPWLALSIGDAALRSLRR